MNSLNDKFALVTGAGRGIGRAIALALADAGANVAVCARTNSEIEEVAALIRGQGRRAFAVTCDVADAAQVAKMSESVNSEFGEIEILVNNSGIARSQKLLNHDDELWHRILAVNLTGVYYVTKNFVAPMIERKRGRIINIASIASKVGGRYITAYAASKHGVLGFTRALALELAAQNITVNAICPGYVETPMTNENVANIVSKTNFTAAQVRGELEKMSPQGRLIEPEEVAALTLFLAGDAAHGITGQAINVDGGTVMF
ncbi:MAG: SDR family NAD(P)-dependent oxidoreductase [Pyrinomonadaceae bacterium]